MAKGKKTQVAAAVANVIAALPEVLSKALSERTKAEKVLTAAGEKLGEHDAMLLETKAKAGPEREALLKAFKDAERAFQRADRHYAELKERNDELAKGAQVLKMPAFRDLEDLSHLDEIGRSSASEDISEQADRGQERAKIAARELDERYSKVKDVIEAARNAEISLSARFCEMGRDLQRRYSETDAGIKARLKVWDAWMQTGGEEILARHGQTFEGGAWKEALRRLPVGRYWLDKGGIIRRAIDRRLDLNRKIQGTEEYSYRNTYTVDRVLIEVAANKKAETDRKVAGFQKQHDQLIKDGKTDEAEALRNKVKADHNRDLDVPSAGNAAQAAGQAEGSVINLESLPDDIARCMSRLNQAVHSVHFQEKTVGKQFEESKLQLAKAVLMAATKDILDIESGDFLKRTDERALAIRTLPDASKGDEATGAAVAG